VWYIHPVPDGYGTEGGTVFALLSLLLARTAAAEDCAAPYTVDAMLGDLVAVETFLRNTDDSNAGKAAEVLSSGLNCMNEVLPRMIVGRALRAVGAGMVAGGNAETGEDWLRTAAQLEQSFDFGIEDLPVDHPIREVYASAKRTASSDPIPVEGSTLVEGTLWLDGKEITEPAARLDQWHILQHQPPVVVGGSGDPAGGVRSWVIEGNRFPAEVLQAAVAVADAKGRKKAKEPKPDKVKPEPGIGLASRPAPINDPGKSEMIGVRDRPWEKTPLMAAGGALTVGAGVAYYMSYRSRQAFDDEARSRRKLDQAYRSTNQLVIATYAILAVGGGTFTWGAILDGGTTMPAVRVRF
jgi:hypothetical protein